MIIYRKVRFQHISYRDALEAQRHVNDRRLGQAVVGGRWAVPRKSGRNVHLIPSTDLRDRSTL